MSFQLQSILLLGIIPALAFLFFSLKGYDGLYKQKTVFLALFAGIIIGVIVAVFRFFIYILPLYIIFIVLFAFFEQLFKTIVLNIGRFQKKKETTIYGLVLGLGFGASFTPFLVLAGSITNEPTLDFYGIILIGTIGFTLFHAATAAYIGYGIYIGRLTKYLFVAIIIQLPFNLILDLARFTKYPDFIYYQISLLLYGLICYVYILKYVMPNILKDTERRKRSKKSKV
jgi:hypothetical protein